MPIAEFRLSIAVPMGHTVPSEEAIKRTLEEEFEFPDHPVSVEIVQTWIDEAERA